MSVSFTALLPWFLGLGWGKFFIFLSYIWQVESADCSGRGLGYVWSYNRLKNTGLVVEMCVEIWYKAILVWIWQVAQRIPFSSNSLIQHTCPPTLSQYHFHFGYFPLTRGLTQSSCTAGPCTQTQAHLLRSHVHLWSTALPNMLSFIMIAVAPGPPCYSLRSLERHCCWSLTELNF